MFTRLVVLLPLILVLFQRCTNESGVRVLFVGNSYTYRNNMPAMFEHLSESLGKHVYVEHVTKGKYTFLLQSKRKKVLEALDQGNKWDYIILQGSSRDMLKSKSILHKSTFPAISKLIYLSRKKHPKAKVLFYMTWPYKYGYDKLYRTNTRYKMYQELLEGYNLLQQRFKCPLVPVGVIWNEWVDKHNSLNLYTSDRSHPSYFGSYLIAAVFYQAIFKDSVFKSRFHGTINKNVTRKIRKHVELCYQTNNVRQWLED